MKKKKKRKIGRTGYSPERIWFIETIQKPYYVAWKQKRLELLKTHNGKCCHCNQPLRFGSTIREISKTTAIRIHGYACQYCDILFVKDASFLAEVNSHINYFDKRKQKQHKKEKHESIKKEENVDYQFNFFNPEKNAEEIIDPFEQNDISDYYIPQLSTDEGVVYLYSNLLPCHPMGHQTDNYHAYMMGLDDREIGFYVEFCRKCNRFYMNIQDYECYLRRLKLLPIRVDTKYYSDNLSNNTFGQNREEMSPLFLNGYTVNSSIGLSSKERQQILAFIMDYRILEKQKVLDYLRMFIRERESNPFMARAISKWKEDKEFVLQHELEQHPKVIIARLEYKSTNNSLKYEEI